MENRDVRNPIVVRIMLENEKSNAELYYKENPGSLIPLFEKELKDLGSNLRHPVKRLDLCPNIKML